MAGSIYDNRTVLIDLEVDSDTLSIDESNNRVGIGTTAPGTTLQVEGSVPYVTLKNDTAENTAGGCESKLIFEDHGNNALGQVEVSHVGTADDEKGQLIIKTNNDSGLQTALTISEAQLATFAASVAVTTDLAVDGVSNLDNTDIDGTLVVDGSNISLDSTSTLNIDNSNTTNGITIGTATSSVPVSIGHTTSETTVNDNLTVTGDLTVNGTTTTINSTTLTVDDKVVVIASGAADSAAADGAGLSVDGASATFLYDHTGTQWEMNKPLEVTGAITSSAAVVAASLDIGGDCDIDGTMEADAITVNGTALNTVIAGVTVTNATNATNSTNATNATNSAHVLVTDNESTAEENLITFVEGATSTTGNVGLEMDGHLTYNPSTGTVSATVFKGNIDAVDGDFDGTLEADAITVGGANLTTIYSPIAGSSSIVTTGALNAGSITSGFTSIDVGAGAISTTGTVTTGVVNSTVTAATGVSIDQNYSVTDASNTTCLSIDFDKTGTSTTNNTMIGINLDMDSTAATGGTNTMTGIKVTPTLTQASGSAQNFTITGMEVIATGSASPEESVVRALDLTSTGGDYNQGIFINTDDANGWDMRIVSSADTGDYFQIATTTHGATTIKTKDDDNNAAAHLSFDVDGDVIIGGVTPKLVIGDAGAEDTMLVFDGNAADFRIGLDDGTDTLEIGKGAAHGTTPAIKIDSNVNVQIMHNTAVADGEVSGDMAMFQAGEDLTAGEVVYFKSDGKVWKAVATAAATSRCVAMCVATVSADAMGAFLLKGFARFNSEFPTWTIGGALYTPEAETSSKNVPEQAAPDTDGDFVQIVGYAISADAIYFDPDSTVVEVA